MLEITPYQAEQSAEFVLDIPALFKEVFGINPYKVPGMPNQTIQANPYTIQSIIQKTTTFLGTPLYGSSDIIGREVFLPISIIADGVTYDFPFAVLGISRAKKWISTEVTELDDEVNELVKMKSYVITMKGFLIGKYGQFPDVELENLRKVFETKPTVRLQSAYSDIFLRITDTVIIEEFNLPEKSGSIGVKDFTMKIRTDSIFKLYVD